MTLAIVGVGLVMGVTSSVTLWVARRLDPESAHESREEDPGVELENAETAAEIPIPEEPVVAAPAAESSEPASTPESPGDPAPAAPKAQEASAEEAAAEEPKTAAPAAEEPAAAAPEAEEPAAAAPAAAPAAAKPKPAAAKAAASNDSADEEEEAAPPPEPDPDTCRGIVIGMDAFERAVLDGEFDEDDYLFYLEPAGVMSADLVCSRSYPAECVRGGILMTKTARDLRKVFFDDPVNPDSYELNFPKEFGYVKSIQHYQPETREHAKYPFSKKY